MCSFAAAQSCGEPVRRMVTSRMDPHEKVVHVGHCGAEVRPLNVAQGVLQSCVTPCSPQISNHE